MPKTVSAIPSNLRPLDPQTKQGGGSGLGNQIIIITPPIIIIIISALNNDAIFIRSVFMLPTLMPVFGLPGAYSFILLLLQTLQTGF